MIVFISDLHFVDESAGKHNVDAAAFEFFTEDLSWFVERRKSIKELKVVFLGDIFDVLRTEYWFGVNPSERPWALPAPPPDIMEAHVKKVLSGVIGKSKPQLDALINGLKKVGTKNELEPELIYVPGNHDRLANLFGSSRAQVRMALGVGASQTRFDNFFMDRDHGVFARHGHEFDVYNFEMAERLDSAAYDAVPIGDPITTELISRIPVMVMEEIQDGFPGLTKKEKEKLKINFQNLDNVRPFSATVEWLLDQVRVFPTLKDAIENAIDNTVRDFERLPFVEQWLDHHDRWDEPLDEADKLQWVFLFLKRFKCLDLGSLLKKASKFSQIISQTDNHAEGAAGLFSSLGQEIRFVVMGHTHEAVQTPITRVYAPDNKLIERIYLNTGTWRQRFHRCARRKGFMSWKDMTYVTIYKPGERDNDVPVFDTWTGRMA